MDYDEDRIYYSYQNLQTERSAESTNPTRVGEDDDMDGDGVDLKAVKRHFREFLREYYVMSYMCVMCACHAMQCLVFLCLSASMFESKPTFSNVQHIP